SILACTVRCWRYWSCSDVEARLELEHHAPPAMQDAGHLRQLALALLRELLEPLVEVAGVAVEGVARLALGRGGFAEVAPADVLQLRARDVLAVVHLQEGPVDLAWNVAGLEAPRQLGDRGVEPEAERRALAGVGGRPDVRSAERRKAVIDP